MPVIKRQMIVGPRLAERKKPTFKDPFTLNYFNVFFPLNVYFGVYNPSLWAHHPITSIPYLSILLHAKIDAYIITHFHILIWE